MDAPSAVPGSPAPAMPVALQPLSFADLPGWDADDHAASFGAFRAGAALMADAPPKVRALGVDAAALQFIARAALHLPADTDSGVARKFFEASFLPHRIAVPGFVTGYYEPEAAASRVARPGFEVPIYRRPDDLIEVSDADRPPGWDFDIRFARRTADGPALFFDRRSIEAGALAGRGLELAFVRDHVDAFFIHVQGSARLRLVEGGTLRIAFDGKSGHAYTSIGRLAVERGLLARDDAHKAGLEAWLRSHPEEGRALMRENRSFIFFRATDLSEAEGPLGAAGVPLMPGRSLAVDRSLHTFHSPVWVDAPGVPDPERRDRPFRRLMIAQDTGSAIVGPARGDLFFGSGDAAGALAGNVRHAAGMVLFLPRAPAA
jgi:membrane-bound lytic murein transglycosylase A